MSKKERKQLKKQNKALSRKSEGDGGRPCFLLNRNYNRLNIKVWIQIISVRVHGEQAWLLEPS
jgi:hypothetical protein